MKKYIALFALLIPTIIFGADTAYPSDGTYNIKWDGVHWVNTGDWKTSGYQTSAFDVNSNKIGKEHVTTFTALRDVSMTVEVAKNSSGKTFSAGFFTYSVDSVGKISINSENAFSNLNVGDTITSEKFSANEMVGLFIETSEYKIYSLPNLNTYGTVLIGADGSYGSGYSNNGPISDTNQAGFWFNTETAYNPGWIKSDIVLIANGVAPASSGAPLPGVFWTVCACAIVISNHYKKSKIKN